MEVVIEFSRSAFKHGVAETDIRYVYKTRVYEAMLENAPDTYGVIGFDTKGNPVELIYNQIDDNRINVFHAMKLRNSFLADLGL